MHRIFPVSLLLLLAAACIPQAAKAQVRRCTSADGSLVYTDRKCTDIGATERTYSSGITGSSAVVGRNADRGCSRSVQDLAYSLDSAIQMGDVNKLAGL